VIRDHLSEEQELIITQMSYMSLRVEMKFYVKQKDNDTFFWIRSDIQDKLARDIDEEN